MHDDRVAIRAPLLCNGYNTKQAIATGSSSSSCSRSSRRRRRNNSNSS